MRMQKAFILFLLFLFSIASGENECQEESCSPNGPVIRFPFRIKRVQNQNCGYSKFFEVSCNKSNTVLQLPDSKFFLVKKIDYSSQTIDLSDSNHCLPRLIRDLNLSANPFQYSSYYISNYSVFSCETENDSKQNYMIDSCLSLSGQKLYAIDDMWQLENMLSCTKMYDIPLIPNGILDKGAELRLNWSTPDCSKCEAKHIKCRLSSNSTTTMTTECYGAKKSAAVLRLIISASVIGAIFLVLALLWVSLKYKRIEENQVMVEQFLADYEACKPTRYSYSAIKRITNQFSDELGRGSFGIVYKGKLSNEILVAVKVLNNSTGDGEEFINEVKIIGKIHHVNILRMVGFCADGFRGALVYEFLPNGSLQNIIDQTNRERSEIFNWEKMRGIAVGIAKGIEYLHQGCDQRILHFDIKPQNVLLDNNLNPKVSDFGTAKLCSKDQSMVSMTAARGTVGYIAPEVFSRDFGGVSYKSDVYSYGILLLEMVGSKRKNIDIASKNGREFYLPEWIYRQLEDGIGIRNVEFADTEEEEDVKIAKNLAIVGLWCIHWQPVDRPSMSEVLKMLEAKEDLNMPSNPFVKGPIHRNNIRSGNNYSELELTVISE